MWIPLKAAAIPFYVPTQPAFVDQLSLDQVMQSSEHAWNLDFRLVSRQACGRKVWAFFQNRKFSFASGLLINCLKMACVSLFSVNFSCDQQGQTNHQAQDQHRSWRLPEVPMDSKGTKQGVSFLSWRYEMWNYHDMSLVGKFLTVSAQVCFVTNACRWDFGSLETWHPE